MMKIKLLFLLLALGFVNANGQEAKHRLSGDASDFVVLTDVVPDAILEVRYYSTYNFVGTRIDGYEQPVVLSTKEAANALKRASDILMRKGYRLKIFDGYRPQRAVNHFVRWAENIADTLMKPYFYPELEKDQLFPREYICLYSGHTRGSTFDLTLFDMKTEMEVDMGGTFDYFGLKSHPDYRGVTPRQWENRMILRDAMLQAGFAPMHTEWWHFTLKDEPYKDTYFTFPVNERSVRK
jgi:D-alanyl-D-alanine dipeptidase